MNNEEDFAKGILKTSVSYMVLSAAIGIIIGLIMLFYPGGTMALMEAAFIIFQLLLTIFIGTPILSLIGAIGVALTVGLRKGGIILSLLVLPLYVPVLIFAASATENAATGFDPSAQIYMLLAFLFLATSLSPWATAAALRMSVS